LPKTVAIADRLWCLVEHRASDAETAIGSSSAVAFGFYSKGQPTRMAVNVTDYEYFDGTRRVSQGFPASFRLRALLHCRFGAPLPPQIVRATKAVGTPLMKVLRIVLQKLGAVLLMRGVPPRCYLEEPRNLWWEVSRIVHTKTGFTIVSLMRLRRVRSSGLGNVY